VINFRNRRLVVTVAAAGLLGSFPVAHAQVARDYISIVGSSTVFPFSTAVAETFGRSTKFKTPKVESTGTGGGFKLFCGGVGVQHPDIANASRRIKQSEMDTCRANGVTDIVEVKIGYDGIVVAHDKSAPDFDLTLKELWLALAKEVPDPAGGEKLVANPYRTWKDVNPSFPDDRIEVLGPPPTSGTRDAFAELALEGGCVAYDWIAALKKTDESRFKSVCMTIREDGSYIEAGENDNLIVQKLAANSKALGVFGYSFLEQNMDKLKAIRIGGVLPTYDQVSSGEYPISRSIYFYVKGAHVGVIPGLKEYVAEFTSDKAFGPEGYLADKGLIALPTPMRREVQTLARSMKPLPPKI
jgi:phosphate transport system substrate-binding protein